MNRKVYHVASILFLVIGLILNPLKGESQDNSSFLQKQAPKKKKFTPKEVIDTIYGIEMYEPLNMVTGGDSIRRCNGYACNSWVKDHYKDDQLLHKGYYQDGQLKIYKNYYPDGTLEREFKKLTTLKSRLKKYYPSGNLKSEVIYIGSQAKVWTDYYRNGQKKYHEEYDDGFNYHIKRASYNKDGQVKEIFELENERKMLFTDKEYHDNNELKKEGHLIYDKNMFDFFKTGEWKEYNKEGDLVELKEYAEGELITEKKY